MATLGQCKTKLKNFFKQLLPGSARPKKGKGKEVPSELGGAKSSDGSVDPSFMIPSQSESATDPQQAAHINDEKFLESSDSRNGRLTQSDTVPEVTVTGISNSGSPRGSEYQDPVFGSCVNSTSDTDNHNAHQSDQSVRSNSRHNENNMRYRIQLEQLPPTDSTEHLVAPITSDGSPTAGASDVLADDSKIDGTFRKIHVRYDNDPENKSARVQHIMHDTGAGCSLTFEGKLQKLNLKFERESYNTDLTSVTGEKFRPIGKRRLCFSYYSVPDVEHWTEIIVLPDPPNGLEPTFDMLFGRDTIRKVRAINWDMTVIGIHYVGTSALRSHFPALRAPSPKPLSAERASEHRERSMSTEMQRV